MRDVNKGNPLKKAVIKQQMMDARMIFTFLYTRIIRQIKATIIPIILNDIIEPPSNIIR